MTDEKYTHQELLVRQASRRCASKIPLAIVAYNIRSLYNVGSLFRTADGVGAEKLWLCGITGIPPSERITKTALGAEKNVDWEYTEHVLKLITLYRNRHYDIVLLEQTRQSIPYQDYEPCKPVCLIVGNEISGISDDLISLCDRALEIEMAGLKISLNVAVALGIVAYHVRQQMRTNLTQSKPLRL